MPNVLLDDDAQYDGSPFAPPALALTVPPTPTGGQPVATISPRAGAALTLDEFGKIPTSTLRVPVLSADPTDPMEGDVWLRSDLNEVRWREGGTTFKVAGTAV